MKKVTNIRVYESQERIANALLTLLNTDKYNAITITQIVQEAQLARKTFYRNFSNKEDVLNYVLDKIFNNFQQSISDIDVLSTTAFSKCYFQTWYLYEDILRLFKKNGLMYSIYQLHTERIKELYTMFPCSSFQKRDNYWNAVIIGTYYNVLVEWIEDDFKYNPSEITDLYKLIIQNVGVSN